MANFYAVKSGRETGIFSTWGECEFQIKGYSGAIYKKFNNEKDAVAFIGGKVEVQTNNKQEKLSTKNNKQENINEEDILYAYVDGSFNPTKNIAGYGLVLVRNNKVIIKDLGTLTDSEENESRNVTGELKGAIKAIELALANEFPSITICYDYMGIELWAKGEWKANKPLTQDYQAYMQKHMKNIDINFKKIAAHSGDHYNDMADLLAKKGAEIE